MSVNSAMRRFVLQRDKDATGVSGTGVVSEGVVFASGKCAMHWLTQTSSIAIYDSIEELIGIHGHEGDTRIVWIDADVNEQITIINADNSIRPPWFGS